jgi:hypothetical protein
VTDSTGESFAKPPASRTEGPSGSAGRGTSESLLRRMLAEFQWLTRQPGYWDEEDLMRALAAIVQAYEMPRLAEAERVATTAVQLFAERADAEGLRRLAPLPEWISTTGWSQELQQAARGQQGEP